MKFLYKTIFLLALAAIPLIGFAQDQTFIEGKVLDVLETTFPIVFGTEIEFQTLQVEFKDGTVSNEVYNDYTPVKKGDVIYVTQGYNPDTETEGFFVREINRVGSLLWLFGIFVVVYIAIAGMKGFRSLIALGISITAVWFILIPLIVAGHNAFLVSFGISVLILGVAIFVTHGLSIISLSSYLGSLLSIIITAGFANLSLAWARVSGLVGDEASTISVLYGSTINLEGVLLAAMIIGILGVLDDVAVMQAAMVREFMYEKTHSLQQVFVKAMRVGREHAAALVNTLVLAYVAVALPLFLIILAPANQYTGEELPLVMQLSNELFVTEFIRSVVGSFGLVITIPIVTLLAILLYKKYPPTEPGIHHHHHH